MEYGKDEKLSGVLEYPFDYQRYIEMRLREIDDLDERRLAKEILFEGLGKVIQCMEGKYQALERRIYEEKKVKSRCYETVCTIIQKEDYDPMNDTLFPVCPEDLEDGLLGCSSAGNETYVETIFLMANEQEVHKFGNIGSFQGTFGEEMAQETVFHVRPALRYRNRIEQLYYTFQDNFIRWETVHTGFIDRFYDVFMECPEGVEEFDLWSRTQVDYGEYRGLVHRGIIPLWNIEQLSFDSTDFLLPCIDGIYYEHEFDIEETDLENGYLIIPNGEILEIRHEERKIIMKSKEETFEGWQALRIVQKETVRSLNYTHPILTNHKKDSYFRRISDEMHTSLLTKADLFRRITELDIGEYIEVTGYMICDNISSYPLEEGMNWFVEDGIFPMESRRVLVLEFRKKGQESYLDGSMVRFAVSQVQLEVSEYRCVGVIIEE